MAEANPIPSQHLVLVTDNDGMQLAFPGLKQMLTATDAPAVSLIYFSYDHHFVFENELAILSKRFTAQLVVCYVTGSVFTYSDILQEAIEAVLNTNTCNQVQFYLYGAAELVHAAKECLFFLSVAQQTIHEQFLI